MQNASLTAAIARTSCDPPWGQRAADLTEHRYPPAGGAHAASGAGRRSFRVHSGTAPISAGGRIDNQGNSPGNLEVIIITSIVHVCRRKLLVVVPYFKPLYLEETA